ncbi:hypothetical protein PTKIN_Ptkin04bG0047500 [Pterospermum kingtungense]
MEPSKIFGGSEEYCHSSESGWTMYIGSLIQGDDSGTSEADNAYAHADDAYAHADETYANHGADSDDSLASDASSGPTHQVQFHNGNMEGGHGTFNSKHEEEADCYLDKKAKKPMKKKKGKELDEEQMKMIFKAKESTTPRTSSKVLTRIVGSTLWCRKSSISE